MSILKPYGCASLEKINYTSTALFALAVVSYMLGEATDFGSFDAGSYTIETEDLLVGGFATAGLAFRMFYWFWAYRLSTTGECHETPGAWGRLFRSN